MLIRKYKYRNSIIGIWQIEESIEELSSLLSTRNIDSVTCLVKNTSKIQEKLTIRLLIKELLGREILLKYDSLGKPSMINESLNISISHTQQYVAVILSENEKIGIDIESISDKILRVRPKFINEDEYIDDEHEVIHLLIHWCAKESVYKAVSTEGVNLKNDISIDKFYPKDKGTITARCKSSFFDISYEVSDKYVLTIAVSYK